MALIAGGGSVMLRSWMRVLPRAWIRWFAVRHCEVFSVNGKQVVQPFSDMQFELNEKK